MKKALGFGLCCGDRSRLFSRKPWAQSLFLDSIGITIKAKVRHPVQGRIIMKASLAALITMAAGLAAGAANSQVPPAAPHSWNAQAAAAYLDGRLDWWLHWPNAA